MRKLSFTGSTGVGSLLLKQAADRIVDSSMELGGNAPFLVLDDADLDAAVEGAMLAKMRNGGRPAPRPTASWWPSRWPRSSRPSSPPRWASCAWAPGTDEDTKLGPMVNAKQRDGIADKVDALGRRRRPVVLGGERARPAPASSTRRPC